LGEGEWTRTGSIGCLSKVEGDVINRYSDGVSVSLIEMRAGARDLDRQWQIEETAKLSVVHRPDGIVEGDRVLMVEAEFEKGLEDGRTVAVKESREEAGEVVHGMDVLLEDRHRQHLAVVRRFEDKGTKTGFGDNEAAASAELAITLEKAGVERVEVLLEAGRAATRFVCVDDRNAAILANAARRDLVHKASALVSSAGRVFPPLGILTDDIDMG